ncbi:MAG TPA: aspartate aminotransferase family protein [Thermoleophilia bacterium]|nr:aspartate aminotransferase family protein [Thermoleophilia bacterium]
MGTPETIAVENAHMPPFFAKTPISIAHGEGVWVWDEEGRRYLDLTAGWGVTSIGHAHPVIVRALAEQGARIIQNPDSGLTYSPPRARLLELLTGILPAGLTRVFFTNSGAEANDAAVKLARKATGRTQVIATEGSFHGRTISMVSATGQARHRDKFRPQMPGSIFVPYGQAQAVEAELDDRVAAVLVEPVQGEGGVRVPPPDYLRDLSRLCRANGTLLVVDEVQTGFCRTGPLFATAAAGADADLLTMAKGIAGGFPLGAFAMTEAVADRLEAGDHGGTYCGNPLACAVAEAVIRHLIDEGVAARVEELGARALARMGSWGGRFPGAVAGARGMGMLLLVEFTSETTAAAVAAECLRRGAFVRQTQGTGLRVFPALTITPEELDEGLGILEESIAAVAAGEGA